MKTKDLHIDSTSKTLPVMESFYTLQGEGFHSGKAAWFIRLGGCDVGCVWCDVKESWNAEDHARYSVEEIVAEALKHPARIAVITGGEPAMYNLTELTTQLKEAGFQTHIETSGAHPLTGKLDWICLSPKKFKPPVDSVLGCADELKVVVFNKSDFLWAEQYASKVSNKCFLFLQPEWSKVEQMTPLIIEYVKKYPNWRLSLQSHKYIHIP